MKYKVSIFILTYNQEKFITQTLESILSQKVNFDFQLVIGEDFSTDSTRFICEKYMKENPSKIKLLPGLNYNIGLIKNYMRTIAECDGQYIAICDGDDYWCDHLKLQKQVDFLDNNSDFSIVYTNIKLLFKDGSVSDWKRIVNKNDTQYEDLILGNHIPSVSVLFKNKQNDNEKLPPWILKYPFGDWPTYLWTLRHGGKIHYIDEITAVYRIDTGISSEMRKISSNILRININILKDIFEDNSFYSRKQITSAAILNLQKALVLSYNKEYKYYRGFIQFFENIKQTDSKYNDLKIYLYSIYKSFI